MDVADEASRVTAPTLVFHADEDAVVPFESGRHLSALIPHSRFVPLRSRNHILLEDEPAWEVFRNELREFRGSAVPLPSPAHPQ